MSNMTSPIQPQNKKGKRTSYVSSAWYVYQRAESSNEEEQRAEYFSVTAASDVRSKYATFENILGVKKLIAAVQPEDTMCALHDRWKIVYSWYAVCDCCFRRGRKRKISPTSSVASGTAHNSKTSVYIQGLFSCGVTIRDDA